MPYVRHIMITFDPLNYDAMMTYMKTFFDKAEGMLDLKRGRLVRVGDDRIIVTTGYVDKESANVGIEQARPVMAGLAEFMIEPPIQRQGEIIWSYDSENTALTPGYIRHLVYGFDTSKYDALMSFWETTKEIFRGVSGLIRIRIARCQKPNNRMFQTVVYDSKTSADAGLEKMKSVMAGMDDFIIDDPTIPGVAQFKKDVSIRAGEVIWNHDK